MRKEELIAFIYEWQHISLSRKGVVRLAEKDIFSVIGSKPIKIITGFRKVANLFLYNKS